MRQHYQRENCDYKRAPKGFVLPLRVNGDKLASQSVWLDFKVKESPVADGVTAHIFY